VLSVEAMLVEAILAETMFELRRYQVYYLNLPFYLEIDMAPM